MRKKILVLALSLISVTSYSFAGNSDDVNSIVMTSFRNEFSNAYDVKWETTKAFEKASFRLDGEMYYAFYNHDGELVALSRNILSSQLPINLLLKLHKNYEASWIIELIEVVHDNETSYYVSIQNPEHTLILESDGDQWRIFKK